MIVKKFPPNGHLSQWIMDQFEPGYRGHAIDVGASDGISVNTTWALEKHHGWTVISVEANPEFAQELKRERTWVETCACSDFASEGHPFSVNRDNPEAYSALSVVEPEEIRDPHVRKDIPNRGANSWRMKTVEVKTVDQILARWEYPKLDALCVDVEGGELKVLMGCDLNKWKPKVIVSEAWDSGHEYPYLSQFGYRLVARNVHNDLYLMQ